MADTLLLRMAADAAGIREWLLVNDQGQVVSPVRAGVPEAGVISATPRAVVLVPGAEVVLSEARIPGRNRQRALRAVPYALEERLAADVDNLHFALGPAQDDGLFPVAVVDRSRMDAWAALLADHGIQAAQWLPEVLAVPAPPEDTWHLLVDEDIALVRTGPFAGFAVEIESLDSLLSLFMAREQLPANVTVYGPTLLDVEGLDTVFSDSELMPMEILAAGWARGPAIDLLQGAYSRREEWGRMLRPWKATAALLAGLVIVAAVAGALDYARLADRDAQLAGQIEAVYREAFPNARRVVNPRLQMEQRLKQLQRASGSGDSGFLPMLAHTGEVLRTTQGVSVNGMSYRDGRLDLELLADDLQILDGLKQALSSGEGMRAEIQSATTSQGQKVKSRIRIQGAGA